MDTKDEPKASPSSRSPSRMSRAQTPKDHVTPEGSSQIAPEGLENVGQNATVSSTEKDNNEAVLVTKNESADMLPNLTQSVIKTPAGSRKENYASPVVENFTPVLITELVEMVPDLKIPDDIDIEALLLGEEHTSQRKTYHIIPEADILHGEDYDTDLEEDPSDIDTYDPTGQKDYIRECNELGVIPVSYFIRHIRKTEFIMRFHGLGPLGAKAIAKPLEINTHLERINLEGNHIEGAGAEYICRVLQDNDFIVDLVLSENHLGSEGARAVCDMLVKNDTITSVNLSGNGFQDWDGEYFFNVLQKNQRLKYLYLSHNHFEVQALRWFRDGLTSNESLRVLDLSWNHIRLQGAKWIAEAVKENYGLKYLNLAWNGLGAEGAVAMGHALRYNDCLTELDLTSNRLPADGAVEIAKGLRDNDILQILRMGRNTIKCAGAFAVLSGVQQNEYSALEFLDLTNVFVNEEFDSLYKSLREEESRDIKVIHGGILYQKNKIKYTVQYDFEAAFEKDPMTKLKRYAERAGLRLLDLFKQFDKDNSMSVSREEFIVGVKQSGLDITEAQIDQMIASLDKDGDGEVDYGELVDGDKINRQTKRRLKKARTDNAKTRKKVESDPLAAVVTVQKTLDSLML